MNNVQSLYAGLSARDSFLLAETPTLMMPRFGGLPDIPIGGRRYIAAREGWFLEARSSAIHARVLVARAPGPLPYGGCVECLDFPFGLVPMEMIDTMRIAATNACPNEWAVGVLCDPEGGGYRVVTPEIESVSHSHIHYRHHDVYSDDLFLDIHSHGHGPAFFSQVDDASDVHGIYISSALGHCESSSSMTAVSRLVVDSMHFLLDWNPWVEF